MQHSLPQAFVPVPEQADQVEHARDAHVHHTGAFDPRGAPGRAAGGAGVLIDRIGASLGFACALHCIAVPLLLGILPALGLGFLADHAFDLAIVLIATACAALAARSGWRAHRDVRLVAAFAGAIALLAAGHALGEESLPGRIPSVLGGVALAIAHVANLRRSRAACARHA